MLIRKLNADGTEYFERLIDQPPEYKDLILKSLLRHIEEAPDEEQRELYTELWHKFRKEMFRVYMEEKC